MIYSFNSIDLSMQRMRGHFKRGLITPCFKTKSAQSEIQHIKEGIEALTATGIKKFNNI